MPGRQLAGHTLPRVVFLSNLHTEFGERHGAV